MLEKFIARQPIFDDKLKVFGYELLFRASSENVFRPYKAASDTLIVDSTSLFGIQALTGHAKAFINLDLPALQRGTARLLPPDQVVIEILENIAPTQEVVQLCAELCNEGYTLALDDYVGHPKWEPLLPLVKFLKVDFRGCDPPARAAIANRHRNKIDPAVSNSNGMRLLAEKIETNDDLLEARSLGYTFFQGYFFCKPTTFSTREIPSNKLNCLRLLHLVASPDFSYDAVEQLLKGDPALVYKLLRYLNSWLVAVRGEIHSIREAIALLGEKEFRRWISVLAVVAMASDKPHELIRTALTRAFFCENIAKTLIDPPTPAPPSSSPDVSTTPHSMPISAPPIVLSSISVKSSDLFLMGLLSVTDAILDRPMEQVLASLPIAPEVRAALCGTANPYRDVYDILLSYERADWSALSAASSRLGIDESAVADCEGKARQAASIC